MKKSMQTKTKRKNSDTMNFILNKASLKLFLVRWIVFFVGLAIMSYGIVLTIVAGLGVSPWDVFHLGLSYNTPLTTGMAVQISGVVIMIIVCYYMRRLPQSGTIVNMIAVGVFIDLFLYFPVTPMPEHFFMKLIVLLVGTVLFGVGAGIYIASNLGAGPRDGLVLVLNVKKGWSISRVKTVTELTALVVGFSLGGPVGIGTLIISFLIGPIMGASILFWRRSLYKYTGGLSA